MPAARKPGAKNGLVEYLNSQAPRIAVRNTLPLKHYHRSLQLLLAQISAYRQVNDEEQLYVMLMRYVSMVVETMKQHKDFRADAPEYKAVQQKAMACLEECERLKISLRARDVLTPQAHTYRRPAEAVRIEGPGGVPDIDWGSAGAPLASAAAAAAGGGGGALTLAPSAPPLPPEGSLELSADLEWPPRSSAHGSSAAGLPSTSAPASSGFQQLQYQQQQQQGGQEHYTSHYMPSNQQLVQKHSLFGPRGSSGSWQQHQLQQQGSSGGGALRPRYPAFDATPIDALWAAPPAAAAAAAGSSGSALPDLGGLSLAEQQHLAALQAAQHPSAGPSLGPQELEVQGMGAPCGQAQPGGTCAMPPPPQQALALAAPSRESAAEAAAAAAAGPKSLSKRLDLRDVHISVGLMNDFLHYAASNTRRGIESCGILAGRLSASDSRFTVTTLIVPKQTGTSDTVEMLGEEEVWEAESSRELVPLGWIHTHPTQTCFLSSVDIHTQCGYQTMLEEAVAIVMAPSDGRRKCGIFRLGTPAGLGHVQACALRGFHASCGGSHYELCGHVYLNPGAKHEVIDLR